MKNIGFSKIVNKNSKEVKIEMNYKLNMLEEFIKMQDKFDNEPALFDFINSAVLNYKKMVENLPVIKTIDEKVFLALVCGYILNDVYNREIKGKENTLIKKGGSEIESLLQKNKDNMSVYKSTFDDGTTGYISVNDDMIMDNQLINQIQQQTGKKVVGKLIKVSKEEADKLHSEILEHLKEDK